MTKLETLCSPIQVGNLTLRNRMISTSMSPGRGYTSDEDKPTQRFLNYLEERAQGGLAAICQSVSPWPKDHTIMAPMPHCFSEEHIPHLQQMAEVVHKHGSLLIGQALCVHNWRRSPEEHEDEWGPSPIVMLPGLKPRRVMSKDDIKIFTEQIIQCGRILKAAGWDAIEVIAGVGSVLNRFISPATNDRTDEYGGSLENRCRFVVEVIEGIRKACGDDFTILVRWSPVEYIKGGHDIEDSKKVVPILEKAGVAWHNLQVGWHESSVPLTTKDIPDGYWAWISEEIKKVATVPVVTCYRETDPVIMEEVLASGKADIIGGLRYSIADPEFPNKACEGRVDEIRKCICCCRCLDDVVGESKPLEYCGVNPRLGPELDTPVEPAPKAKKVMIAGSGPAGLAAALTAAQRGHNVTVYDRSPRIGGCLVMSSVFAPMYERLIDYYRVQLEKNYPGIKVKLETPVTAELVEKEKPDVVIVAVGGKPIDLDVPGGDGANVVTSHDFLELVNGNPPKKAGITNKIMWTAGSVAMKKFFSAKFVRDNMHMSWPFGGRVAIIGGGLPGCSLAEGLIENKRKREIAIIDEEHRIGWDVGNSERFQVRTKLKKYPVQMEEKAKVIEITKDSVKFQRKDGTEVSYNADTVAVTLGFDKNLDLADELQGKVDELYVIGDCAEPARMADATKAGYQVAMQI